LVCRSHPDEYLRQIPFRGPPIQFAPKITGPVCSNFLDQIVFESHSRRDSIRGLQTPGLAGTKARGAPSLPTNVSDGPAPMEPRRLDDASGEPPMEPRRLDMLLASSPPRELRCAASEPRSGEWRAGERREAACPVAAWASGDPPSGPMEPRRLDNASGEPPIDPLRLVGEPPMDPLRLVGEPPAGSCLVGLLELSSLLELRILTRTPM